MSPIALLRTRRINGLARVEHRDEKDDTQPALKLKRTRSMCFRHANCITYRSPFPAGMPEMGQGELQRRTGTEEPRPIDQCACVVEFAQRWDASITAPRSSAGSGSQSSLMPLVELGFMVMETWHREVTKLRGFRDDLTSGEFKTRACICVCYKFDEDLFAFDDRATRLLRPPALSDAAPSDHQGTGNFTRVSSGNKQSRGTSHLGRVHGRTMDYQ